MSRNNDHSPFPNSNLTPQRTALLMVPPVNQHGTSYNRAMPQQQPMNYYPPAAYHPSNYHNAYTQAPPQQQQPINTPIYHGNTTRVAVPYYTLQQRPHTPMHQVAFFQPQAPTYHHYPPTQQQQYYYYYPAPMQHDSTAQQPTIPKHQPNNGVAINQPQATFLTTGVSHDIQPQAPTHQVRTHARMMTNGFSRDVIEIIVSHLSNFRDIASLHRSNHLFRSVIDSMLADPDSAPSKARKKAHFNHWKNKLQNNIMKVINMETIEGIDAPELLDEPWCHEEAHQCLWGEYDELDRVAYKYSPVDGATIALMVQTGGRRGVFVLCTYWVLIIKIDDNEQCVITSEYKENKRIDDEDDDDESDEDDESDDGGGDGFPDEFDYDRMNPFLMPLNLRTSCDLMFHKSLKWYDGVDNDDPLDMHEASRFENVLARLKEEHHDDEAVNERIDSLVYLLDNNVHITRCTEWREEILGQVRHILRRTVSEKRIGKSLRSYFNKKTDGPANRSNTSVTMFDTVGITSDIAVTYKDDNNFGLTSKVCISQPGEEERYCTCNIKLVMHPHDPREFPGRGSAAFKLYMKVQKEDAHGNRVGACITDYEASVYQRRDGDMRCSLDRGFGRYGDPDTVLMGGFGTDTDVFRNLLLDLFPDIRDVVGWGGPWAINRYD